MAGKSASKKGKQGGGKSPADRQGGFSSGRPGKPSVAFAIVLAALVLGTAARFVSLGYAPRYSYQPDHADFLAWSLEAYESGPTHIYARHNTRRDPWLVNFRYYAPDGRTADAPYRIPHACNYLPLSTYIFAGQGWLWRMLADDVELAMPRQLAARTGVAPGTKVDTPVANTWTARFVGALPSMLFDFLLAWGVAMLVRALRGENRSGTLEAVAFALALLAPPIFLESSFWNQVDSWLAAPLVWSVVFLLRRQFTLAGVVYGLALLIKPQAILLGPVLVFVLVAMRLMPGGSWSAVGRMVWMGVVALVVAFLVSLPHSLAGAKIPASELSKDDASWHSALWFKRAYVDTVTGDLYPRVTLNAFNIWWLDWLAWGGNREALDSTAKVIGITKDTLGKLLLIAGVLATWLLCARKWAWVPESWVVCAFLVAFCAFMLPTRVHERYIYLCIPFLIALAVHRRVWIAPLVLLLIVGTFEMTSFRWAGRPETRGFSVLLSLMAIAAFLYSFVVLLPKVRARKL